MVGEAGRVHDAAHRLHDVVEPGATAVRPDVAKGAERAIDDVGIASRYGLPRQAHGVGGARREPLDEDVGLLDQPQHHLCGAGFAHVHDDGALACVLCCECQTRRASHELTAGRFDLDDLGAE